VIAGSSPDGRGTLDVSSDFDTECQFIFARCTPAGLSENPFQVAEVIIPRNLFGDILRLIAELLPRLTQGPHEASVVMREIIFPVATFVLLCAI